MKCSASEPGLRRVRRNASSACVQVETLPFRFSKQLRVGVARCGNIMGCSGGHELDPIYSLSIYARFSGRFFCKFS